jgi:hypothetical protein
MKIYTYRCADGVTRTRCRQHIAGEGGLAPARRNALIIEREGDWENCYACAWDKLHLRSMPQGQTKREEDLSDEPEREQRD